MSTETRENFGLFGFLEGCRVIDFGNFITGPFAAVLLADLGAEVIKVERPEKGDPFRSFETGLYGPQFQAFNRNKKSIAIDLKNKEDRARIRELVRQSDVFIENSRPGVMQRLEMDYPKLRDLNPSLVYCSITGFGKDGPKAHMPAYDTVAQASSGYLSLFVSKEDTRVKGPAAADAATGLYAAYGILAALFNRHKTGKGEHLEISMMAAMAHFASEPYQHYFVRRVLPGPQDRARTSQSFAFPCADGNILAIHLSSPEKFWKGLIEALDHQELDNDERFNTRLGRVENHRELEAVLAPIFAGRPCSVWLERLEKHDVPHSQVLDLQQVLDDPQARHLGLEVRTEHPVHGTVRSVANPVVIGAEKAGPVAKAPPELDQHGDEIRSWLEQLTSGNQR